MLKKTLPFILGFIIIFTNPLLVMKAQAVDFSGLVPVCNTKVDAIKGGFSDPCDFNMVMSLINTVINFILIDLATPLFALIIIYVAWLYISAGGDPGNVTKAKTILKNVVVGYVLALAAWLIVKTILVTLGFQPGENAKFFDYLK